MTLPRVCVFAPGPIVTVTIETRTPRAGTAPAGDDGAGDDIHLHVGGQGVWIGRMLAELGADVVLCGSFGGETGQIALALLGDLAVELAAVKVEAWNGAYVHDRREGERREIAWMPDGVLTRHDVDDLYGRTLGEALASDALVMTGTQTDATIPADVYRRLAHDVRANGRRVIADLSGERLDAAVAGGVDLLKVSHDELERDGRLEPTGSLADAAEQLRREGAGDVVITLGADGAHALVGSRHHTVVPPSVEVHDPRGAGDSVTAALTVGVLSGLDVLDALKLAIAAGAVNVTRRGLGTGSRAEIDALAAHVDVTVLGQATP